MPIYEHGYRQYTGPKSPRIIRILAIARQGFKLHFQSKIMRRFMWLAWTPFFALSIAFFLIGQLTQPGLLPEEIENYLGFATMATFGTVPPHVLQLLREQPQEIRSALWNALFYSYLSYTQFFLQIFILSIVGQRLISEDLKYNTYTLYSSRPLTRLDYILGKFLSAAFPVALITILPALVLYLISIAFSPGFATVLDTWQVPLRILLFFLCSSAPLILLILAISTFTTNGKYVTFTWFGLILMSWLSNGILNGLLGNNFADYISIFKNYSNIGWLIFDMSAGIEAFKMSEFFRVLVPQTDHQTSLIIYAAIAAVSFIVIQRKLKQLEHG